MSKIDNNQSIKRLTLTSSQESTRGLSFIERESTKLVIKEEECSIEDETCLFFTYENCTPIAASYRKDSAGSSQSASLASEYIREPEKMETEYINKAGDLIYVISGNNLMIYNKEGNEVRLKQCVNINDINYFSMTVNLSTLLIHLNNGESYMLKEGKEVNMKLLSNTVSYLYNNYSILKSTYIIPNSEDVVNKLRVATSKDNYKSIYNDLLFTISSAVNDIVPYDYMEAIYKVIPVQVAGDDGKERYLILTNKKVIELVNPGGKVGVEVYPYSCFKAISVITAKNCFNILTQCQSSQFIISLLYRKILGVIKLSHANECLSKLEINKY
jgi:hypothetical protein